MHLHRVSCSIKVLTDLENALTCVSIDMQDLADLKRDPWATAISFDFPARVASSLVESGFARTSTDTAQREKVSPGPLGP